MALLGPVHPMLVPRPPFSLTYLYLLYSKVEECEVIADTDGTVRSSEQSTQNGPGPKPTSICCTVRSRNVRSLRTLMADLGPVQPMLVPRPPFSLTHLYLLYSKVEECEVIADADGRFRPRAAHASPQASIQFDHHQLTQQVLDAV